MVPIIMSLIVRCQTSKAVVPLQLDATGKVKYDALAKLGQRKDKVVHTSLSAMVPRNRPTDPELVKPDDEEVEKVREGELHYTLRLGFVLFLV
jgi:hypothetical protein